MNELKYFVKANKVATQLRKFEIGLFGTDSLEGGILYQFSNDIFLMTAMRLAEMVGNEEYDDDKTLNAVVDIEHAKSEDEIENIIKEYVKSHGQMD